DDASRTLVDDRADVAAVATKDDGVEHHVDGHAVDLIALNIEVEFRSQLGRTGPAVRYGVLETGTNTVRLRPSIRGPAPGPTISGGSQAFSPFMGDVKLVSVAAASKRLRMRRRSSRTRGPRLKTSR